MGDRVEHFEAELGQFRLQQGGEAGAEQPILVDEQNRLDRLAGAVVQLDEIFERVLGSPCEAPGAKRKVFLRSRVTILSLTPTSTM